MIQARVHNGRLKLLDPIPESWEGCDVVISPATPDDPVPDFKEKLAALRALGPMEWEPGEQERIEQEREEMDRNSREKMDRLMDRFN